MFSFRVQLIGGIVLHNGCIGEILQVRVKLLPLPAPFINGLSGKGVHVVTVNDYLASRDAETIGLTYKFLGLSVGLIITDGNRKSSRFYNADITYGTNNEFGFDYLRDNMAIEKDQLVQREVNYCIIDEVDSILIDEARTPLIISGPAQSQQTVMRGQFFSAPSQSRSALYC